MSTHIKALEQAVFHFEHKGNYSRAAKVEAAQELAEWGVFSNRHIALFTGLRLADLSTYTGKTDRTGGSLTMESIPHIVKVINLEARGEVDYRAVKRAIDAGCSALMLSRLTGRPQSTLSRHARMAVGMATAA